MRTTKPFLYRHKAAESIVSRLVKSYLIKTDRKTSLLRIFETKEFKHTPAKIHSSLHKLCQVDEEIIYGRKVWKLTPRVRKSSKVVFFSHGGGHLNNITTHHWRMIEFLIKRTDATFIVPDYPLLPDYHYKETYEMVEEVFYKMVHNVDCNDLIFLGDSAGGAISLALAQLIRDQKAICQPSQIILISPELDASKVHEDIPQYEKYDVMLTGQIFDVLSPYYVRDCPRDHFLVSPGLGDLNGLGKISVFTGTHDILYPYSLDFKDRLEKANHPFNFYVYPKMMHVWTAITLMKEARVALRQMAELINPKSS